MTYSLDFDSRALKEWKKLGDTVRQQFKKWRRTEALPGLHLSAWLGLGKHFNMPVSVGCEDVVILDGDNRMPCSDSPEICTACGSCSYLWNLVFQFFDSLVAKLIFALGCHRIFLVLSDVD